MPVGIGAAGRLSGARGIAAAVAPIGARLSKLAEAMVYDPSVDVNCGVVTMDHRVGAVDHRVGAVDRGVRAVDRGVRAVNCGVVAVNHGVVATDRAVFSVNRSVVLARPSARFA